MKHRVWRIKLSTGRYQIMITDEAMTSDEFKQMKETFFNGQLFVSFRAVLNA